jgi:hypothetical protein
MFGALKQDEQANHAVVDVRMRCPVRHGAFDFGISLNSMSYEVLSLIVALNAVVTFFLFVEKANRPARLSRKIAKLLWRSDPIVPRHDPPKIDVGKFSHGNPIFEREVRSNREFFLDFKEFAGVVNSALAESYVASRFRLQDEPEVEVSIVRTEGPTPGRCFRLYYNQYPVGRLEIHPWVTYTNETPEVWTDVEINRASAILAIAS